MMKKQIVTVFAIFFLIYCSALAAEPEAKVDHDTGIVTVDYTDAEIAGRLVTIEVVKSETEFEDAEESDICFVDADYADSKGNVVFTFKHISGDGSFKVRLSSYKSFVYKETQYSYDLEKATELLEKINSAKENKNTTLAEILMTSGFTMKNGDTVSGSEVCALLKVPDSYSYAQIRALAKIIVYGSESENLNNVLEEISGSKWLVDIDTAEDTDKLTVFLKQYEQSGFASISFAQILEDYEASEQMKSACLNNIKKSIPNNAENLEKELVSSIVLKCISSGYGYDTAKNIIKKYNTYITDENGNLIDISKCNTTSEPKVYGAIIGNTYSSLADLKHAFDKAIEASKTPDTAGNNAGGGSGSGTSGGGSAGIAVTPQLPVQAQISKSSATDFKDLNGYEWAKDAVDYLCNAQVIHGRSETEFAPSDNVTRAEFITMIVLAHKLQGEVELAFGDVSEDSWCSKYIKAAVANSVISGLSENEFGTNKYISRQDAATIISRLNPNLPFSEPSFNDNSMIAEYAINHIGKLRLAGIINGTDNNNFAPNLPMTRAEAAVIIYRELKLRG